jgi:hypothetical protein
MNFKQDFTNDKEEFYDSETEPSIIEDNNNLEENHKINKSFNEKAEKIVCDKLIYAVKFLNNINPSKQCLLNINNKQTTNNQNRIFINPENAKNLCKQDPDNRRFKAFRNFIDAYSFSYNDNEIKSGCVPTIDQLKESLNCQFEINKKNDDIQKNIYDLEKLAFPAPKKSEINLLRSHIEKNEVELFKSKVLTNPRYLISSGDSPIIVQVLFF